MLSVTEIVDLLKEDFLEELTELGFEKFADNTYYVCNAVESCKYRCLDKADMQKHIFTHAHKKKSEC